MLIRLSDGRVFKLSWQHTEVSEALLKHLENKDRKLVGDLCDHFDQLLETHFGAEMSYYYGQRIHGATECFLLEIDTEGNPINAFNGIAWCSAKDIFSKEKGRKRSLTDALDKLQLPKVFRSEIWKQYFERH